MVKGEAVVVSQGLLDCAEKRFEGSLEGQLKRSRLSEQQRNLVRKHFQRVKVSAWETLRRNTVDEDMAGGRRSRPRKGQQFAPDAALLKRYDVLRSAASEISARICDYRNSDCFTNALEASVQTLTSQQEGLAQEMESIRASLQGEGKAEEQAAAAEGFPTALEMATLSNKRAEALKTLHELVPGLKESCSQLRKASSILGDPDALVEGEGSSDVLSKRPSLRSSPSQKLRKALVGQ